MEILNQIYAVVVLYKIDFRNSVTLKTLNDAVKLSGNTLDVLIYDNSEIKQYISNSVFTNLNFTYIHDKKNPGVSFAYNYAALKIEKRDEKKWLLILDQDTNFPVTLIFDYMNAIENHKDIKLFCPLLMTENNVIFSPCHYFFKRGFPLKSPVLGRQKLSRLSPVNSGILVEKKSFFKSGMYNDLVKLDFSDFQFIERFKKYHDFFYVMNCTGYQDFSNNETDYLKLNLRYYYFCDSIKNIDKDGFFEKITYFMVGFMRAVTLSIRSKKTIFFKTFFNSTF